MTDPRIVIFGAFLGFCFVLLYASYHSKALVADQSWASVEEYHRLPLACVGAPLYVQHSRQFLSFLLINVGLIYAELSLVFSGLVGVLINPYILLCR